MAVHEGGCVCGAVRYRVKNEDVEITRGELKSYEHRSDESGRWLAGGTFDDPGWLKIERHTWTRSAQHWVPIPPGLAKFEKSSIG